MPIVTIKDVASMAGVSVGTASMALNGKENVNAETRKKVLAVAEGLGYKPNKYARFLTSKKTNVIGLIVTDITNPFFGVLTDLVQQELAGQGYDIMLGISKGDIANEKNIVQKFIDLRVDGVISVPSHELVPDVSHYHSLRERGIPVCFITTYYNEIDAPCVMTDLSDGSYCLTKYLVETGHRCITCIVGNRAVPVSNLRVEGYLAALRETSIAIDPGWIVEDEVVFQGGYHAAQKILDRYHPDAILAMNDFMAMGVLKCLKERGLRVPQDISVAGYDDVIYASLLETPLTTVRQPIEQMCKRAVAMMLEKMANPQCINEKVLLKPQLVVRESTKERL